jgi:hypothetical protein
MFSGSIRGAVRGTSPPKPLIVQPAISLPQFAQGLGEARTLRHLARPRRGGGNLSLGDLLPLGDAQIAVELAQPISTTPA